MPGMVCVSSSPRPEQALPAGFLERLGRILSPAQFDGWRAALAAAPPAALRLNPLRAAPAAVQAELEAAGFSLSPVDWAPEGFLLEPDQRRALTESAAFAEGRVYLQNLASMLPPLLLDPRPGEEVLDLCAAPGSKTTQIAALMQNQGRLAAVERSRSRFFKLQAVCRQLGAEVATYLADGRGVGRKTPGRFDRVLVDAPCSSEGRFRLEAPQTYGYWSEKKVREMARLQKRLLLSGWQSLKPGGVLVYSTCTYAPEENEAVLEDLLRRVGAAVEIEAVDLPIANLAPGLGCWQGRDYHPQVQRSWRVLPTPAMEGFFLARLRKRA